MQMPLTLATLLLLLFPLLITSLPTHPKRRTQHHKTSTSSSTTPNIPPCKWYTQTSPLSHFSTSPGTFTQRVCIIDLYVDLTKPSSIFLYTGNESPLEEYINNNGLLYTLAPEHNALIVFIEHRYQGKSTPVTMGMEECLSYATIENALADYAGLSRIITIDPSFIPTSKSKSYANPQTLSLPAIQSYDFTPYKSQPIIAFGGSYGGMLSAYLRFIYPSLIAGSIAASAPIYGLPLTFPEIDGSSAVISNAIGEECGGNIKAALVLVNEVGKIKGGLAYLSEVFELCEPLGSVGELNKWISEPWFDLAEGSFPFASSYIPYAVGPGDYQLPPWPLKAACSFVNGNNNFDFITENIKGKSDSDVEFKVYSKHHPQIEVTTNWATSKNTGKFTLQDVRGSAGLRGLLEGVRDAVGVWCNVTKVEVCHDVKGCVSDGAPPAFMMQKEENEKEKRRSMMNSDKDKTCTVELSDKNYNCWVPTTCNANLNLPNTLASGIGRDFYWPPTVAKGSTLTSLLGDRGVESEGCGMERGLYGLPDFSDAWSTWMDTYFGGKRIEGYSNVVFSNGSLDPWSSAGVYSKQTPSSPPTSIQKLNAEGNMLSIMIEGAGHHLDLFFPSEYDMESVLDCRRVENDMIGRWIGEWRERVVF